MGWLQNLPFGAVIFANPADGEKPLPEAIAAGDLDGDLYFVCWNKTILRHIVPSQSIEDAVTSTDCLPKLADDTKKALPYNENWLDDARELMMQTQEKEHVGQLTGQLYKAAERLVIKAASNIHSDDFKALANAYKQSLDLAKHGVSIPLPHHLHEIVNQKVRYLLSHDIIKTRRHSHLGGCKVLLLPRGSILVCDS
jgi:hypothetical protein